jgi:hypothetical protein
MTMIDWDCDGYGPGSALGPDADDNDATVNTSATALAKFGSTTALLSHLGYAPRRMLFIATTGSDASGQPNDEARPYRSWDGVAGWLQAGDAVIWRGGVYADKPAFTISGTPSAPLILMAYPGEKVVLDQESDGIVFVSQSNVILDGLILQNSTTGLGEGIFFGDPAANITIRNLESANRGRGLLGMNGLSNVLIERSVFHDMTQEHCIYLGSRERPNTNITLRNNLLYNGAYNGFQHNGRVTNLLVEGNIIHTNDLSALSFLQGVSSSVIRNNLMFGNGRNCLLFFDYPGDPSQEIRPYDQKNNTFVNNTCWVGSRDPSGATINQPAINLENGGFPVSMDNLKVENNILVTHDYPVIQFGERLYLNTATIRNNVMLNVGGSGYLNYNEIEYGFNSLNGWDALKGGNILGDPLFKAAQTAWYSTPQNYDFTLRPGSPAIGLALAAEMPPVDLLQAARGTSRDAGAYQYSASGGPTLRVVTSRLPDGVARGSYSQTLSAAGGVPPYSWVVTSGTLPPGLTLSKGGVLSGVPDAPGAALFTVQVADSQAGTAVMNLTLTISTSSLTITALACTPITASQGTGTCTITLSGSAPAGGAIVALASNLDILNVPASVLMPEGAASAVFTVAAGPVITRRSAIVTATLNGISHTAPVLMDLGPGQATGGRKP